MSTVMLLCLGAGLLAFTGFSGNDTPATVVHTLDYFKKQSTQFAAGTTELTEAIKKIDANDSVSLIRAKEALKTCRLQYKSIEFFLTYFLSTTSAIYNQPNKPEVEEGELEIFEPVGLQVMETLLFQEDVFSRKKELLEQAELISSSAHDLHALLYKLKIDDNLILESLRLELIRIMTLGITGFDTPELKTGVTESAQALKSIKIILEPFLANKGKEEDSIIHYLHAGINLLEKSPDFDSFDRLGFLTKAALPLQEQFDAWVNKRGLGSNKSVGYNHAGNLFKAGAVRMVSEEEIPPALVRLGQQLFFEKKLSGNKTRSCATCHQPEKYFTDQLPKSPALDGKSFVGRNTPSLFYSAYQFSQFWDGRARTVEEQINAVLISKEEMDADHEIMVQRLLQSKEYVAAFKKAFAKADSVVSVPNVATALAAFLKTLAPMNSPFDRYIAGEQKAITREQIKGFNLFMGKAQCGTCHFAPLFNGLVPPDYTLTELENLGLTGNTDFTKPLADEDEGRFRTLPVPAYKGAFKTPTIRNSAQTAPYMHNGAFATLEQVLEFYNKGGGAGLGLNIPAQTLSPKPLNLDSSETRAVIQFLHALTDSYSLPSHH